jgi:hypothetical protein
VRFDVLDRNASARAVPLHRVDVHAQLARHAADRRRRRRGRAFPARLVPRSPACRG